MSQLDVTMNHPFRRGTDLHGVRDEFGRLIAFIHNI